MKRRDRSLAPLRPLGTDWTSRPRLAERTTRPRLAFFDRIKFLLVLAVVFALSVWTAMGDNPLISFNDALREQWQAKWVLWTLFAVELVRQVHFFVTERWSRYYLFWRDKVFARLDARVQRIRPWTRYRLSRAIKVATMLALLSLIGAWAWKTSPLDAFATAPSRILSFLFGTQQGTPMIFQLVMIMVIAVGQFALIFWFLSRGGVDTYFPDDIKTRFSDVWGQDPVMHRVQENLLFLEQPELVEERGGHMPGGILLWGPPGTGKTLLAEACAGETGRPYVFVDPGAFINMFFGVGILKVKSLFRKLRKLALKYGGVVVFFDEADSLGNRGNLGTQPGFHATLDAALGKVACGCHGPAYLDPTVVRMLAEQEIPSAASDAPAPPAPSRLRVMAAGLAGGGGGMGTLQALLTEISGLKKPRGLFNRWLRRLLGMQPKPPPTYHILIMMATNLPQALDPALLRPGRIDRIYRVGYPTKEGRRRTFEGYLAKTNHALTDEQVDKLATITPYSTGASIKDLVNEALILAIRDGRETITWADVLEAKTLKALGPSRDVELVPQDRHGVAIHEACHAIATYRLKPHHEIDLATIDPGNDYLGMVAWIPVEERFKRFRSEYEADIMVSIASLAGERIYFEGDSASGVSADLVSATTIAYYMEAVWGMGETIASHPELRNHGLGSVPIARAAGLSGEDAKIGLDRRVEERLARLMRRVESLLREEHETIVCLAHALETHLTLSGADVVAVIERVPGVAVDGSVYRDPAFVRRIERYHADMLEAHRAGLNDIQIPIPVPAVFAPPDALAGSAASVPAAASAVPSVPPAPPLAESDPPSAGD